MPYCVNCGVELTNTAKRCPLCGVEVVLPAALRGPDTTSGLPQQQDLAVSTFDRNLWIQVVSVLMFIPALVSLVIDGVFGEGFTWSLYVAASLGTVWVWCVSPFLYRRNIVPLWISTDAVAMLGLLYVIDAISHTGAWFLSLAAPITLSSSVLTLLIVELARRKVLRELHIVAAVLIALGAFCIVVEGAVDLYVNQALKLQWSLLVLACCIPLAVVAVLLQRRRGIVESMKMWFRM
jgi:hypothetical protein